MPAKKRILSIDGGGIRGIIASTLLVELEDRLRARYGKEVHIADFFDLFTGTSTGGIIVAGLLTPDKNGRPLWRARDIQKVYLKQGAKIFSRSLAHRVRSLGGMNDEKYDGVGLEKIVRYHFGTTFLSELIKPTIIPTYELSLRSVFFFRSYKALKSKSYDFPLTDVTRATSAAPTYFEPIIATARDGKKYATIDGGTVVNNPSLTALIEAQNQWDASIDNTLLLSLGTGEHTKPLKFNTFKDRGLLPWMKPLITIMMEGAVDMVDYQVASLYKKEGCENNYLRIKSGLGDASGEMDCVDSENSKKLEDLAYAALKKNGMSQKLDAFIEELGKDFVAVPQRHISEAKSVERNKECNKEQCDDTEKSEA